MAYFLVEDCPICHSKDRDVYYKGTLGDSLNETLKHNVYACTSSFYGRHSDLMKCGNCELVYASVHPTEEALIDAYSNIEDDLYLEEENARVKTFHRALQNLNRFCPSKGRMFEFGSYTGVFLEQAKNDGWQVAGAELSSWAREIAFNKRGIPLRVSMGSVGPDDRGAYDSVVMWDVIEHLTDPLKMVNQAAALLKPGGILGLSTMVLDSLSSRVLKERYPFLMEMHMVYFTRATLISLLEQCGFEILEYKRHARFVSILYLLSRIGQMAFFYKCPPLANVLRKKFVCLSAGLRDVYARKKMGT